MNLRDLKYLVAVSEHKNFSKAAQECSTTQPTLSNQIKKLEDYLQVEIFDRGTRHVRTTETGEQIVDVAKRVIETSDLILQIARMSSHHKQGQLTLGGYPTLLDYVAPEYIFKLKQHYKKLAIELIEENEEKLVQLLELKAVDLTFLSYPVENEQFDGIKLFEDQFFVAMPTGHHLSDRPYVEISDLQQETLLLLNNNPGYYESVFGSENQSDIMASLSCQNIKASSLETLLTMTKHELGVTIVPSLATDLDDGDVTFVPLGNPQLFRSIWVYWRRNESNSDLLKSIAALITYKPIR